MELIFKICSHCNVNQEITNYYKKSTGLHGVDSICRVCVLKFKKNKYLTLKKAKKGLIEVSDNDTDLPLQAIQLFVSCLRLK